MIKNTMNSNNSEDDDFNYNASDDPDNYDDYEENDDNETDEEDCMANLQKAHPEFYMPIYSDKKLIKDQSEKREGNNVPDNMQKNPLKESGIFFGKKNNRIVGKPKDSEGHTVIFGGSGSGKSSCIVVPTLTFSWDSAFVTIDIKGELKREYDEQPHERKSKVFNLREEAQITYDPLEFIRKDSADNLVSNVKELVNALLPLPIDVREPFWIESARNIVIAAILYYLSLDNDNERKNFIDMMDEIMTIPPNNLIEKIANGKCKDAKIFINNFIIECESPKEDDDEEIE